MGCRRLFHAHSLCTGQTLRPSEGGLHVEPVFDLGGLQAGEASGGEQTNDRPTETAVGKAQPSFAFLVTQPSLAGALRSTKTGFTLYFTL